MKKIIGILLALALVLSFNMVATAPVAAAPPVTSGLVLHLDAGDAGSITKDAVTNRVSKWADLSTAGNDAAQATAANQPLWVDNVLAGRPVIRFDGVNDYFETGDSGFPYGNNPRTFIGVIVLSGDNSHETLCAYGKDASGQRFVIQQRDDGIGVQFWGHFWGTTSVYDGATLQTVIIPNNATTTDDAQVYLDGMRISETNLAGSARTLNTVSDKGPWIARDTGDNYSAADIAEILVYDRALSDAEREGVEQYLRVKWLGKCVTTATGTGSACLGVTHGAVEDLVATAAPSLPSVSFPHGMFSFKITGLSTGQTVTLTIELPDPVPVGTVWWKNDNGRWYSLPNLNDNGNNIMKIRLTDGGVGDSDTIAGQITDPGGPGNPMTVGWDGSPTNKATVMAPWIALLGAIVAGTGLLVWRRRRAQI